MLQPTTYLEFSTIAITILFFIAKPERYTYEQFYQITIELLTTQYKVKEKIAKSAAYAVWNNTKAANMRLCKNSQNSKINRRS